MKNQRIMKNNRIEPNSGSEGENNMEVVVVKDGQRLPLRPTCGQAVYETACSFAGNDEELTVKSASNRICPSQHGRLSTQGKERAYFTRGRYLSCRSQMVLKKALTISCSRSIRTDGGKFINTTDLMMLSDEEVMEICRLSGPQVMEICRLSGPHLELLNFHLLSLASFIRYHYEESTTLGDISKAEARAL